MENVNAANKGQLHTLFSQHIIFPVTLPGNLAGIKLYRISSCSRSSNDHCRYGPAAAAAPQKLGSMSSAWKQLHVHLPPKVGMTVLMLVDDKPVLLTWLV